MSSYQEKYSLFHLFFPVTHGKALRLRQSPSQYQSCRNSRGLDRGLVEYKALLFPIPRGYFQVECLFQIELGNDAGKSRGIEYTLVVNNKIN